MIAIVDYGVGNIFSLLSSFKYIGADARLTNDIDVIEKSDRIVLPGVGAFEDAAALLRSSGLDKTVVSECKRGKPLLGICLGMQLLFEKSFEYGEHKGLGLIKGSIKAIKDVAPPDYKIPHIGWNLLKFPDNKEKHKLFKYISEDDFVYFVHSYYAAECAESVIAYTEYGAELTAAAAFNNVMGTQFHPEKSGDVGLNILRAFCEI